MPKTVEIIAATRIITDDGGTEDLGQTNAAAVLERLKSSGYPPVEIRRGAKEAKGVKRAAGNAPEAADLAAREIDRLGDETVSSEERATRKRRLIKGPKEFRNIRRK
jgi:hypothetical protein